jgi:hypothetical protein
MLIALYSSSSAVEMSHVIAFEQNTPAALRCGLTRKVEPPHPAHEYTASNSESLVTYALGSGVRFSPPCVKLTGKTPMPT